MEEEKLKNSYWDPLEKRFILPTEEPLVESNIDEQSVASIDLVQ